MEYNVEDAVIKTDILLEYLLKMTKTELLINQQNEVDKRVEREFLDKILEVANGKPVQYITHKQEFMKLNFYVDENVLIPQPDTEILVEETVKKIYEIVGSANKSNIKVLDLCTGSGAIAISIFKQIESLIEKNEFNIEVWASDISKEAIKIAKKNAITNNAHINFIESNMFEKITKNSFDIIVSNPPYIETDTILQLSKEVQSEPHIALDGGNDGLDFYRIIAKEAAKYINNQGYLLVEIGYNQKEKVTKLFKENENYANIKCIQDLGGNDRVIETQVTML